MLADIPPVSRPAPVLGRDALPDGVGVRARAVHELGLQGVAVPRGWLLPGDLLRSLATGAGPGAASGLAAATVGGLEIRTVPWLTRTSHPYRGVRTIRLDASDGRLQSALAALWDAGQPADAILVVGGLGSGTRGTAVRRLNTHFDEVVAFCGEVPALPERWALEEGGWRVPRTGSRRRRPRWLSGVGRLLDAGWDVMEAGAFAEAADALWIEWCATGRRTELVDICPVDHTLVDTALRDVVL